MSPRAERATTAPDLHEEAEGGRDDRAGTQSDATYATAGPDLDSLGTTLAAGQLFLSPQLRCRASSGSTGRDPQNRQALRAARTRLPRLILINQVQPSQPAGSSRCQNSTPGPDFERPKATHQRLVLFMLPELHSWV